ncbi:hypothetical protein AX17_003505 [Amanita inopinata Kibby_2008]|nr:hypothetical protein AX17_003505 [Amanita inopinata Kibby_2008]
MMAALLTTRQTTSELEGTSTTVIVQPFADRTLVLVTQLGKVGTLIQASLPSTTPLESTANPLPTPSAAIQLTTLLGSAPSDHMTTLNSLYASQIATIIWLHESNGALEAPRRSIVVGLALRPLRGIDDMDITESERATFYGVMDMLQKLLDQA